MSIYIKEAVPHKLSGQTSLFVSFDYNPEIVDRIKKYYPAIWDKKSLTWEIAASYLSKLVDELTYLDNIILELMPSEIQEISDSLTEEEISEFKYKPFDHQIDGINFLIQNKKSLLLDAPGVGKSLEMMYMAEALYNRRELDHCLIICGVDSLRSQWKSEIQKFSKLSVRVLGERTNKNGKVVYDTVKKRVEELLQPINEFFVVINITTIRDDSVIKAISSGPNKFGMIAVDEVHRVATKSSSQGSNLLKLKSDYKVAATGTPITNSALSVYVPLSWTENDHATLTNYKSYYCNFGGFNNSQIVGFKNLDVLQNEIDACSIRRTFAQIKGDMPKKNIEYELVEMSDEHAKFYEAIRTGVKEEADKIKLNANNLLALTTRLRQATAAPSVLTSQNILSSKVERCVDLAEEILANNEKLVILGNFIEAAETLEKLLYKYNPIICTGKQSQDYIENGISSFRNLENFNLLIGTHSKLGTGFSFPECHYMLMLDQPFTFAQFDQSCDRIYRITSEQPVFIKVLACKDTIDERVKHIVETKKDLSDYLVDGIMNETFTKELEDIIMNL